MKIGIDARLYGVAGPGRYISNLIKELEKIDTKNDYVIFVTKSGSDLYHPQSPNFKKWIADFPVYSMQEQSQFLLELMKAHLDLLHVPHFNVPALYRGKMVVTIHDLTMEEFSGKETSTKPSWEFMLKRLGYKFVTKRAVNKAAKIIVPSRTVAKEIKDAFRKVDAKDIFVTYEGVDKDLLKNINVDKGALKTRLEEMKINKKYFLYVGSAFPHKNLNNLVISYKALLDENKWKGQLVFAGAVNKFSERLAGFVNALGLRHQVVFAARYSENQYVTDLDLSYLYAGAHAYVFPSLKEGFSITPLEAQAFSVPVLLSDIPTHREVFQNSAIYFNPKSTLELSDALLKISGDEKLREQLKEAGLENVKRFSWAKMAKDTLAIYENSV